MKDRVLVTTVVIVVAVGIASVGIYFSIDSYLNSHGKTVFCREDPLMTSLGKCRPGGPISVMDEQHDSKLVIKVGEPIDHHGLAPIITTQVSTSDRPITKIIDRNYHPTNYGNRNPDEHGTSYELIPGHLRIDMQVQDENDLDAIDWDANPSFARIQPGFQTLAVCDDEKTVAILYGAPIIVPIKKEVHTVFNTNLVDGLLPNEESEYVLSFASFFRQEVNLPDRATVISSTSERCRTEVKNYEQAYYDRVVFQMENPIKDYVPHVLDFGTDRESYAKGDTIVISGHVSKILKHNDLVMQAFEPEGSIIEMNLMEIEENGKFEKHINTEKPLWSQDGMHLIKLQYDKDVISEKSIMFTMP